MNDPTPLEKISRHANWDVSGHGGPYDIEFDPYPSIKNAFWPAWSDPVVMLLGAFQVLAYAMFAYALVTAQVAFCVSFKNGILHLLPSASAIQILWALKAVYLLEKASTIEDSLASLGWRVLRTATIALPFSFVPGWIIGCIAWPFLRINIQGGARFYDQSLLIGQYVQNSIWYIGGRNGRFSENLQAFSDVTIINRSRYWDAAAEQHQINALVAIILVVGLGAVDGVIGARLFESLISPLALHGYMAVLFVGIAFWGVSLTLTNTAGIAAISILEFSRQQSMIAEEPDLPIDTRHRWLLYLPHAIAGIVLYAMLILCVFPGYLIFQCPSLPL